MAVFSYQALTAEGALHRGLVDADSRRAAWQALRTRGVFPTALEEATPGARRARARVPAAALAAGTRQLAILVEAGVPLAEALAALAGSARPPALADALTVARARLAEGATLADALATSPRIFEPLFRDLVRAGEESGALPGVLARLADYTEARAARRARLRAALTYPLVMTGATVAVLVFLLAWVMPEVAQLFADTGTSLPLPTRALLGIADVVAATWWIAVPLAVGGLLAARAWVATARGGAWLDAIVLEVPVAGRLVRTAATARLARTLATLLGGGMPLEQALGVARDVTGNRTLAARVEHVRAQVREGRALAPVLAESGAFPAALVQLAGVGERSGTLAAMLERAADAADTEVEAAVGLATSLVEPALVLVMGGVVLALVAAVLLPIFELNTLVH